MPKAIAPSVAQINIERFKKSAIQSASGKQGHLENHNDGKPKQAQLKQERIVRSRAII
jgi:hypothetical protein